MSPMSTQPLASTRSSRSLSRSLSAGLIGLLAASLATPALAAPKAAPAAPAAASTAESTPEIAISDRARAHFRAGVAFLQDPDGARYAEALREFQAAYADSPSWKILGNLGISAMKLERDGDAVEAFTKYLAEGGTRIEASERAQVQRDLDMLSAGVVWVTLRSTPPGAQLTDERVPVAGAPVVNRYPELTQDLRIGIRPGRHRMTVELAGYQTTTWTFDAQSGTTVEHTFELTKQEEAKAVVATPATPSTPGAAPASAERPTPLGVYIGLAATGALAIGGGVTGMLALQKNKDYQDENESIASETEKRDAEDLRKSGQTLNLVTDALFAGALVAGGVTAYLYFTRPEVTPETQTAVQVAPAPLPGGGGVWMQGRF